MEYSRNPLARRRSEWSLTRLKDSSGSPSMMLSSKVPRYKRNCLAFSFISGKVRWDSPQASRRCSVVSKCFSLKKHLYLTMGILRFLGFLINEKKTAFIPSQVIELLGTVINSYLLSFSLPLSKVTKVTQLCEKTLRAQRLSLRQLVLILGNFSWSIPTVPFAQAYFRKLQRFFT